MHSVYTISCLAFCYYLQNKTEFTFLNIDKRQEDEELVKVEVMYLPLILAILICYSEYVLIFKSGFGLSVEICLDSFYQPVACKAHERLIVRLLYSF